MSKSALDPNGLPLEKRLMELIRERLDGGESELETLPNGHVCGHVVTRRFEGMDYAQRRAIIRAAIEAGKEAGELSNDDVSLISTLLTYTPDEWQLATQES